MSKAGFLSLVFCLWPCLSGCFETQFQYKTTVKSDGSIERATTIEGRGAKIFKSPEGEGWEARTWETPGEEALFKTPVNHIEAKGKFPARGLIPSDFSLDVHSMEKNWSEEDKQWLETLGIKAPYAEHLFSGNKITTSRLKGWLTETTVYEEKFQLVGILKIIAADLRREIQKQNEIRGESFSDAEVDVMADLRLADEILPLVSFRSELQMPGKIVSTNAAQKDRSRAVWKFSLKDFENDHSTYILSAVSRQLRPIGLWFLVVAGSILLLFILLAFFAARGLRKKGPRPPPQRK